MGPLMRVDRLFLFVSSLTLVTCIGSCAGAASRQMVVVVERPLLESASPPDPAQLELADELRNSLVRRFRDVEMEGHLVIDGNALIEANETEKILSADCLAQIIISVADIGYRVKAKIYDKASKKWFETTNRSFGPQNFKTLESSIANEVIPPIFVRILEIAQPTTKAILLADCLTPASLDDDASIQAGRMFSNQYGSRLKRNKLSETYSVVPLVSSEPRFYNWWCTELRLPRKGIQREDTFTITGSIEHVKTTSPSRILVSIQIKKFGRNYAPSDYIILDRNDPTGTTLTIMDIIQRLANDL